MQRLEVSGAVRPIYGSLGVKRLIFTYSVDDCTEIIGRWIFKRAQLRPEICCWCFWMITSLVRELYTNGQLTVKNCKTDKTRRAMYICV